MARSNIRRPSDLRPAADELLPLVVAHRGFSAPENTLGAAEAAIRAGAPVVECDVHLSADGAAIVIHDATVDRTTNGSGAVHQQTLATLQALDAGAGERVPSLAQLIDLVDGRARLLIELKWRARCKILCVKPYIGLAERVHADVRAAGAESWCIAQSFLPGYLEELHLLGSQMELHQLVFPWSHLVSHSWLLDLPPHISAINCYHRRCTAAFVRAAHACNLRVGAWTVDDEKAMSRCVGSGVDWLITNRVDTAATVLRLDEKRTPHVASSPFVPKASPPEQ